MLAKTKMSLKDAFIEKHVTTDTTEFRREYLGEWHDEEETK